jgi:hypothetical protein
MLQNVMHIQQLKATGRLNDRSQFAELNDNVYVLLKCASRQVYPQIGTDQIRPIYELTLTIIILHLAHLAFHSHQLWRLQPYMLKTFK